MQNPELITSTENPNIKFLKKLGLKKYRKESGKFIVENLAIIEDALRWGNNFETIFMTDDFLKKHPDRSERLMEAALPGSGFLINAKVNRHYSSLDTPSGITAVYQNQETSLDLDRPVVYLNAINDPGNLGTILRTALAFGFANVILDENCADIHNPKTISAAKDSIFKLNIREDEENAWLKANQESFPVYVTSSHDGASLKSFEPAKKYCLVLGSESHGVSPEILRLAQARIRIGISKKIESLNVASAASILFYSLAKDDNR